MVDNLKVLLSLVLVIYSLRKPSWVRDWMLGLNPTSFAVTQGIRCPEAPRQELPCGHGRWFAKAGLRLVQLDDGTNAPEGTWKTICSLDDKLAGFHGGHSDVIGWFTRQQGPIVTDSRNHGWKSAWFPPVNSTNQKKHRPGHAYSQIHCFKSQWTKHHLC